MALGVRGRAVVPKPVGKHLDAVVGRDRQSGREREHVDDCHDIGVGSKSLSSLDPPVESNSETHLPVRTHHNRKP